MLHHTAATPGLIVSKKGKHIIFFFIFILYVLFVYLFAQGRCSKICTMSCGFRLVKMFIYNLLCVLIFFQIVSNQFFFDIQI